MSDQPSRFTDLPTGAALEVKADVDYLILVDSSAVDCASFPIFAEIPPHFEFGDSGPAIIQTCVPRPSFTMVPINAYDGRNISDYVAVIQMPKDAVLAERERCAKIVENYFSCGDEHKGAPIAEAIRSGK